MLHRLEFALYLIIKGILRTLPHAVSRGFGRGLGSVVFRLNAHHRKITQNNMKIAFPDWDDARVRATALSCFRHWGAMVCDTISATRFSPEELTSRVEIEGWEHLERAQAMNLGVMLYSAHLGTWEMAAHTISRRMGPLHVIGRPLSNPLLDEHLRKERERMGLVFIKRQGGAHRLAKLVRKKHIVGIVVDQRVRPPQGILVPFLGEKALTSPVMAIIASHSGAPAVPVFCYAVGRERYHATIHPPLLPEETGRDDEAIAALTRRYMAVIEDEIRRHPEQWMWLHRRWRLD